MNTGGLKRRIAEPLLKRVTHAAETRPWALNIVERSAGRPTLHEFSLLSPLHQDGDAFLVALLGDRWTSRRNEIREEHLVVQQEIAVRAGATSQHYPKHFAVEDHTALVLFAIVRVLAPALVVETGVADGRSTATILAAMHRSNRGRLHSVDVRNNVGALVSNRERWTLQVLARGESIESCVAEVARTGPVDIFLHDGDHSRAGQQADISAALTVLRTGGLLLSDDVDWSYVFHDTCKQLDKTPTLLLDTRKIFGALWR